MRTKFNKLYLASYSSSCLLDSRPLGRDSHEVSFHGVREAISIERGLNDSGRLATNNHGKRLSYTLHLLQYIVLSHKVNNSHHQLHVLFVNAHEYRIVKDIDDRQEKRILCNENRMSNRDNDTQDPREKPSLYVHSECSSGRQPWPGLSVALDVPE